MIGFRKPAALAVGTGGFEIGWKSERRQEPVEPMVGDPDGGDGLAFGSVFKLVFGAPCRARRFDRLLESERHRSSCGLFPFRDLGGGVMKTCPQPIRIDTRFLQLTAQFIVARCVVVRERIREAQDVFGEGLGSRRHCSPPALAAT
jgi:hypothetical protein